MHKTKKKTKTVKLPKPIKVKKEKSDEDRLPQPMTHYLDDRLEMIKQIFNTLKPKTIVNLAPDFLKTQALEEIEETCLNELLCISTKRLKSIITATKCPTDTESSDNDSDVERHEEHISLEEISSDSEIEGSTSNKVKKKRLSKGEKIESAKKDTPNADNAEDGQISVLELLELQARARAIRSQLALEPVTKIEVDSDGEKRTDKEKNKSTKTDDKTNKNVSKRHSSERESKDSAKKNRLNGATENLSSKNNTGKEVESKLTKKIKLKRTYRTPTNKEKEDENLEKQSSESSNDKTKGGTEKCDIAQTQEKSKEQDKNKEPLIRDIKKEKKSRSPSPDVIPILAEPETLLIADSSDEEKNKASKKSTNDKQTKESNETETQVAGDYKKNNKKELQETEGNKENSPNFKKNNSEIQPAQETPNVADGVSIQNSTDNTHQSQSKMNEHDDSEDTQEESKVLKNAKKEEKLKTDALTKKSNDETVSANHSDDDQNDDVISLGGDLENEMNEQLENEVNVMQSPYNKKATENSTQDKNKSQGECQAEDVISLESSEDERANVNQSWHSRYMKSSKVSKVLAASRLGKRVRDKIKKSKYAKKETSRDISDVEKEKSTPAFTSKHEDGSIEQYKELLEMRQHKSSS